MRESRNIYKVCKDTIFPISVGIVSDSRLLPRDLI